MRPGNNWPTSRRRLPFWIKNDSRSGHVLASRRPRVIQHADRGDVERQIVFVEFLGTDQIARLAWSKRAWGVIELAEREGSPGFRRPLPTLDFRLRISRLVAERDQKITRSDCRKKHT